MFGLFKKHDRELEAHKERLEGKVLAEVLKTKVNRHRIFWVGRSEFEDRAIRIGVEYQNGTRAFYDWEEFGASPRCKKFEVVTEQEADAIERDVLQKRNRR